MPTRSIFDPRPLPRLGTTSYIAHEEDDDDVDDEEATEDEGEGEQEEDQDEEEGGGNEEIEPVFIRKRPRLAPADASMPATVAPSRKASPSGLLGLYKSLSSLLSKISRIIV